MSTPTVIEGPIRLEPVTADPFIADLELPADTQLRVAAFAERSAASPRRRIYD